MKKSPADKMMKESDAQTKRPKVLICLEEQMVPGFGTYKKDDQVTDPAAIEYLKDNPHFAATKESK